MYHPVCINTGMMALPPRGPSSVQWLWEGRCVGSRAEAGLQERAMGKSLTWRPGAAHAFSLVPHGWLGTSKLLCFPQSPAKSLQGCCVPCRWMDLGAGASLLNLWALGARTAGKSWAVQYRVLKALSKKEPHLNVSGWATNMPSYF